jgi:hypothetical protein
VVLVFVRPNSSYVRPKLKVIGQMSCQVKYLFAALFVIVLIKQVEMKMAYLGKNILGYPMDAIKFRRLHTG